MHCLDITARAQWLTSLEAFLEKLKLDQTSPAILTALRSRLISWMQNSAPHKFYVDELPILVDHAVQDQDRLGWQNLTIGRISNLWTDAQEQWLVQVATRWKKSSAQWAKKLIVGIWDINWEMWMQRNNVLHHPQHPWKISARQSLDSIIQGIWSTYNPSNFLARDHRLFQGTPTFIIKNYTTERKQQWILFTRHARMRKSLFHTSSFG
jgi:hypothetical protein